MRLDEVVRYVQSLGPIGFVRYFTRRALADRLQSGPPYRLRSRYTRHPLWCRPGTSDLMMFAEIICHRAFRCLDRIKSARLIVDCGANVGYSSAYFLTRFPDSKLIAIEPDANNFAMLERNLSPYAGHYEAIRSAIWSHPTGLVLSKDRLGAGLECARTVRPARLGEEAEMHALDIGTILERSGFDRIDILKIDIEGAERVVFEADCSLWLPRVDNIVIELHDIECRRAFHRAIAGEGFDVTCCDDQVVCLRADRGHRLGRAVQ